MALFVKISLLFALFQGLEGARNRKPLPLANLTIEGCSTIHGCDISTLAELKAEENDLVDTLFKIVKDLVKIERKAAEAAKANVTVNGTANESAAHPNGIYGDPKEEYMKITMKQKDAVGAKFAPACAKVLEAMVARRMVALVKIGMPDESVGLDMATHFQVQCPGAIPMPEESCDKHATALAKLVDQKKLFKKMALLRAPKSTAEPEDGKGWCKNFFGDFFDAVFWHVTETKIYQR